MDIDSLIRPHLLSVKTYDAVVAPEVLAAKAGIPEHEIVKLNGNENPYGCSPLVREAVLKVPMHIYPDPEQSKMRTALSKYTGLNPENIVVGAGADELIDLLFRLFVSPGDTILDFEPTFGMYSFCANVAGGEVVFVQRDDEFEIDVNSVIAAIDNTTKIIFVTSPNNPTGNLVKRDQLLELLSTGLIIVVDEAYYEFSGETSQDLVEDNENLIILRTFSKWAGLAGLRVGYGIMNSKVVGHFMDIKPPYNVNIAAEAAMIASLQDSEYLLGNVTKIVAERSRLFDLLSNTNGIKVWPSYGNFILCEFEQNRARIVYEFLAAEGIFVRNYDSNRLKDCIRVAVGTPDQTDVFIRAIRKSILNERGNG